MQLGWRSQSQAPFQGAFQSLKLPRAANNKKAGEEGRQNQKTIRFLSHELTRLYPGLRCHYPTRACRAAPSWIEQDEVWACPAANHLCTAQPLHKSHWARRRHERLRFSEQALCPATPSHRSPIWSHKHHVTEWQDDKEADLKHTCGLHMCEIPPILGFALCHFSYYFSRFLRSVSPILRFLWKNTPQTIPRPCYSTGTLTNRENHKDLSTLRAANTEILTVTISDDPPKILKYYLNMAENFVSPRTFCGAWTNNKKRYKKGDDGSEC